MFTSCVNQSNHALYKTAPGTLEELQSGFFESEFLVDQHQFADSSLTIVAFGHTYPLLFDSVAFDAFIETVKAQHPDYVFVLGDIVRDNSEKEWQTVLDQFAKINSIFYFAPGNHDLNFHYERYFGKHDHQFEAESRYIDHVGYRYKTVKDNFANYVFVNMNDSIDRVLSYLNTTQANLDKSKPMLLLTSQCVWHNKHQIKGDLKSWTNKPFTREELLPHIGYFDVLIHGDWGGKFFRGSWKKPSGQFDVMGVGNRLAGDSLYISRIEIHPDTIIATGIPVPVPSNSSWYKNDEE